MAHLGIPHVVRLAFPFPLNVSVQVGDVAYYCNTTTVGTHTTADQSDIIEIGVITTIIPWNGNTSTIIVGDSALMPIQMPTNNSFIMFSKDNKVNLGSILGYYAEVRFVNTSKEKAELFSTGCGFSESSK